MNHDGRSPSPEPSAPVRVAVVGAGQFGELHVRSYLSNPQSVLVAVVDRDIDRAREVAERYSVPAHYDSIEALLDAEDLDGISVVTSAADHLASTSAALRRGVSVLLEKPVVSSSVEGELLRDAAAASAAIVMPAHILRFAAPYRGVKQRLAAGEIGALKALSFRRHRTIDHDRLFPHVHPVLMTMVHDIDLALWWSGATPVSVTARELTVAGRAQPTVVWAEVQTDTGEVWSFQVSWSLPDGESVPDACEVIGDAGALSLSVGPPSSESDDILTPPDGAGALGEELEAFVRALRPGADPAVVTLPEALTGIALAERIIAAAREASA